MNKNSFDVWLKDCHKELLNDGHFKTDGDNTYYFLPFVYKKDKYGHFTIEYIQKDFPKEFLKELNK